MKYLFVIVLFLSILSITFISQTFSLSEEIRKGPSIDKIKFIHYLDENIAVEEIRKGNLDTYFYTIPLDVVSDLKNEPNVKLYEKLSTTYSLLLNPASPLDDKSINPFKFQDIRFAMNYLINRNFIANEILQGYGIPLIDPFGINSPDYSYVVDVVESFGIRYDPSYANTIIKQTLLKHSAEFKNGKWYYNDMPITLKILIRSDDINRKIIGEIVSNELEKIGFNIIKEYSDLTKALKITSGSDPQSLSWHVYTEAFASSSFSKYNDAQVAQMYSPWYANMPGGQNPGFWQYANQTLDEITQKLVFSNFTTKDERNVLLMNSVEMGIQESVRIFLVKNIDPYVASSTITGLINDFGAGISSKYSLYNVKSNFSDALNVGVKQIYQGSWNNVAGFVDAYSNSIYSNLADSSSLRHPYTGEVVSFRNELVNITSKGPEDTLSISPDALVWDPITREWSQTPYNESKSKVIFKIQYSNWHHGIPMDKFDLLYSIYFLFEWGSDLGFGDVTVDPEYTSRVQLSLPLFKGFEFITNDMVETYIDLWHYDEKEIFARSGIWTQEPWEITAAIERLVSSNQLSFSKSQSTIKNVDWLSLIIPEHALLIKKELNKMIEEKYIPDPLKSFINFDYAKKRYEASINWIQEYNHAVISNGPFYLSNYNPAGRTIDIYAFNDPSYPFNSDHFSNFETPVSLEINEINTSKFIKIGDTKMLEFLISQPNASHNNINFDFFFSDYNGNLIYYDSILEHKDSLIRIVLDESLTNSLPVGPLSFKMFITNDLSSKPTIYQATFLVHD
ncbi:MAG: ABC transporter substrate-binding protein [Nitrososphaeraceae archaeon]